MTFLAFHHAHYWNCLHILLYLIVVKVFIVWLELSYILFSSDYDELFLFV